MNHKERMQELIKVIGDKVVELNLTPLKIRKDSEQKIYNEGWLNYIVGVALECNMNTDEYLSMKFSNVPYTMFVIVTDTKLKDDYSGEFYVLESEQFVNGMIEAYEDTQKTWKEWRKENELQNNNTHSK